MDTRELSASSVWTAAADRIKAESTECYRCWFEGVIPLRIEDESVLVLGVPNDFYGEWLVTHYTDLLNDVLSGIADMDFSFLLESGHEPAPVTPVAPRKTAAAAPAPAAAPDNNAKRVSLTKHTFENFIVSDQNRLAYMSANAAVESPGIHNPLYIYGASGVGKTHLLLAAAHAAQTMPRPLRVRYTSCSELLEAFYDLIGKGKNFGEFRSSLRDVDLLLVDDIHMLAKKPQIQEEFFNLFNTLSHQHKQIILTSDKQPCEIEGLEARLVTRFESGMTADIGVPEIEGRLAILRMMREDTLIKVKLADPILEFLAQQISSSVRRLKGAFMRLATYASVRGNSPLTIEQAETLLAVQLSQESTAKNVSMETIQRQVASEFGISVADILGAKRPKNIAEPRMAAMYLCRKMTTHSLPEIGAAFGKTHATIINAMTKIPELCDRDESFRRTIQKIEQQLKR